MNAWSGSHPQQQQGIALVMVLIFLVVLSLLVFNTFEEVSYNERLLRNTENHQTAFIAAEDALSSGERWLVLQVAKPQAISSCDDPPCWLWEADQVGDLLSKSATWWQEQAIPTDTTSPEVASTAHYVLEEWRFVPYELSPDALSLGKGHYYYKVTSQSVGRSEEAQSMLRSIYVVNFN